MVKEALPSPARRDSHQLSLSEELDQPGLAVGPTPEVCGEHLQEGEGRQTPVYHGPDPPARVEVKPGHQAEIVDRDGAVIPDYQTSARHWDVLQSQDGVSVPQPQVGNPQLSSESEGVSRFHIQCPANWVSPDSFLQTKNPTREEEQEICHIDQEQGKHGQPTGEAAN